jgi:phosphoenolpyruvate carboxykinase (GTP)
VNWFRKDADGKFVWPGFGDNMRVLSWMIGRIEGTTHGDEHAFGLSPRFDDIDWGTLDFTREQFERVISVQDSAWRAELELHDELFTKLAHGLPAELAETKAAIEKRVSA